MRSFTLQGLAGGATLRRVPRRLGQHFLRPASVEKLLAAIAPLPADVFLEIGPGTGALTVPLAARCARIVAIELDARLAARLRSRAPSNLRIVEGDALVTDLTALVPVGSRLAGNLPYYASSPLLRRILELRGHLRDAHVMLQEEVARRVVAAPGSREYGALSVLTRLFCEPSIVRRFPAGAFSPPPRVSSALVRLAFLSRPRVEIGDTAAFEALVFRSFSHRRRTLENNLRDSYPNLKEYLRLLNLEGSRRAETLSVVEFAALCRALGRRHAGDSSS
jgi:16S rRNA (adenine1518-N6/adenine1519-N6)-dimethyltransferase